SPFPHTEDRMERTAMSRKEFERGAVFRRVEEGELKVKEAAALLRISLRQAKRLYKRYRSEGQAGRVHRSVGRASNHAHRKGDRDGMRDWMVSAGLWSRVRRSKPRT